MKKLLFVLLALVIVAVALPTVVEAGCPYDCFRTGRILTYRVSYFDNSEWVSEFVSVNTTCLRMRPSAAAADLLGLRAGYNCFVSRVIVKR